MSSGSPSGPDDGAVRDASELVRARTSVRPAVALVLGSGLGDAVAGDLAAEAEFAYGELPGFPSATVPGHAGRLAVGSLYGIPAAAFLGRIHFYEGHGIASTTLIPRLAAALGASVLVLTNASGGLNPSLRAGGLMLIRDHLNFLGASPLAGWRFEGGGPAFVDLSAVYDRDLRAAAERAAREEGVEVSTGVYVALPGPSYETPAETRYLAGAGADAVGMSTVPEAVAAVALGMRVLGISCVTNVAGSDATHEDVLASARAAASDLRRILARALPEITQGG